MYSWSLRTLNSDDFAAVPSLVFQFDQLIMLHCSFMFVILTNNLCFLSLFLSIPKSTFPLRFSIAILTQILLASED